MEQDGITRRAFVRGAAAATGVAVAARVGGGAALAAPSAAELAAPELSGLTVTNDGRPFAGDSRMLTTLSGAGGRSRAVMHFRLARPARVEIEAVPTRRVLEAPVWRHTAQVPRGRHTISWSPGPEVPAQTYMMRTTVIDDQGRRRVYGADRRSATWVPKAPVVRVMGVDAMFTARSYAPGQRADLRVAADASELTVQIFRSGAESVATRRRDELNGIEVGPAVTVDWRSRRDRPALLPLRAGDWPSGFYFAKLVSDRGAVGYAPFIVRPSRFGASRVAVVLPTNTWHAYNFRDADGDGWGDTWYAGGNPPVDLRRPFLERGVPFRFWRYDLGFLRWLQATGKHPDVLAEDDVERFRVGDNLRAAYDLVIYPGHTEYVTDREYDVVERYRDLGGSLMFLSANNFFWRVERRHDLLYRTALWRDLGRPEAALIGVQYLGNDDGSLQDAFTVQGHDQAPWLFDGTALGNGSRFGHYGIEIDARTRHSPPETQVLATISDLFGAGRTAEMTYYELPNGAKVFAAGVLAFGGSAGRHAVGRMLDNLWARMTGQAALAPVPAETAATVVASAAGA